MSNHIKYLNNHLRKTLVPHEKSRYNAYKKRECERRRRFRIKGRLDHVCFTKYCCESCRRFHDKLILFQGYSFCEKCIFSSSNSRSVYFRNFLNYSISEISIVREKLKKEKEEQGELEEEAVEGVFLSSTDIFDLSEEMTRMTLEWDFQYQYPEYQCRSELDILDSYINDLPYHILF